MKQNNIPLKLDERIYDIEDIKTVITADEKDVGKMGYFANSIHLFKNLEGLDGIKYGKLIYLSNLDYGGDKSDKCFVCSNQWAYRYFIPKDSLKPIEKKYRPFSIEEWKFKHSIGETIIYRYKGTYCGNHREAEVMYLGYAKPLDGVTDEAGKGELVLGDGCHGLQNLFDNYEMWVDGEWQTFGVLVEDEL